ncbi:hypothetical protein Q9S36_33375 [Microbacterium sp. ARD31]|jgi:hypothetical protein|uniref:hypothetical protein n=1 Tax=Microbacterium sp. ARD31 TaxID=2962576 RepID=UPI002880D468|nr:hypothetical protein [Microbacterium sp. ARD31]MDT0185084.1 hypothetical protein [Microbacterium sp. ARD31]
MTLEYTIELDHSVWIPVPLAFPWNGYEDVASWSQDVSTALTTGIDAPDDVRARLRDAAQAMSEVDPPLPGALERFWHLPEQGGPERLVHLYVTSTEATTAEELAQLARAGVGGFVQTVTVLEDTGFDVAMRAVVLTEIPDRSLTVLRCLGLADGYVFVIELIEEHTAVVEELEPVVEALFRSIRLRGRTPVHAGAAS